MINGTQLITALGAEGKYIMRHLQNKTIFIVIFFSLFTIRCLLQFSLRAGHSYFKTSRRHCSVDLGGFERNDKGVFRRSVIFFSLMRRMYIHHQNILIPYLKIFLFVPFPEIHNARPHSGQKLVASRMRSLLHSQVYKSEVAGNNLQFSRFFNLPLSPENVPVLVSFFALGRQRELISLCIYIKLTSLAAPPEI